MSATETKIYNLEYKVVKLDDIKRLIEELKKIYSLTGIQYLKVEIHTEDKSVYTNDKLDLQFFEDHIAKNIVNFSFYVEGLARPGVAKVRIKMVHAESSAYNYLEVEGGDTVWANSSFSKLKSFFGTCQDQVQISGLVQICVVFFLAYIITLSLYRLVGSFFGFDVNFLMALLWTITPFMMLSSLTENLLKSLFPKIELQLSNSHSMKAKKLRSYFAYLLTALVLPLGLSYVQEFYGKKPEKNKLEYIDKSGQTKEEAIRDLLGKIEIIAKLDKTRFNSNDILGLEIIVANKSSELLREVYLDLDVPGIYLLEQRRHILNFIEIETHKLLKIKIPIRDWPKSENKIEIKLRARTLKYEIEKDSHVPFSVSF